MVLKGHSCEKGAVSSRASFVPDNPLRPLRPFSAFSAVKHFSAGLSMRQQPASPCYNLPTAHERILRSP
jgi:hypothetical protein